MKHSAEYGFTFSVHRIASSIRLSYLQSSRFALTEDSQAHWPFPTPLPRKEAVVLLPEIGAPRTSRFI